MQQKQIATNSLSYYSFKRIYLYPRDSVVLRKVKNLIKCFLKKAKFPEKFL